MNILILTDKYFPTPLANSICAQNIADVLINSGHKVDILAYRDSGIIGEKSYNGCNVTYITPDLRTRLFYYSKNFPNGRFSKIAESVAKLFNRAKKLIMLPLFPMYSFYFPLRIYQRIIKMHIKRKYDLIVSVFTPFDSAVAGYWFKKRYPKIKWCLYSLDTFINQRYSFLNKKGNTNNYWLPKFLDKCDLFIYMRSRKKEYFDKYFDKWKSKMKPCDIPLMTTNPIVMKSNLSNDIEQWVYAGSLGAPHYITDDLIDIFLSLNDGKMRELHFYSSGDSFEKLKKIRDSSQSKVICNSYVAHDELMRVYQIAHVLVSVKYSNQISAKIFEYMSYGKRIVHISGTPDDPNAEYVRKYAKGIVLTPYKDTIKTCTKQLFEWLNSQTDNMDNIPIDYSYFKMNRPEYTADVILNCANKLKKV